MKKLFSFLFNPFMRFLPPLPLISIPPVVFNNLSEKQLEQLNFAIKYALAHLAQSAKKEIFYASMIFSFGDGLCIELPKNKCWDYQTKGGRIGKDLSFKAVGFCKDANKSTIDKQIILHQQHSAKPKGQQILHFCQRGNNEYFLVIH